MVLVSIHVRPTSGYHHPNKIDHLLIDSAERLETIQEKYSSAGSSTTRLYYGDHELPLNSSIGSHNFDDGTILECCRSPAMSAALTACLKDFEKIKKLSVQERTMENLLKILQTPTHIRNDPDHEMWKSWSNDKLKTRTINLATIKAVLQRQGRYHVHDLPKCTDCQSLFAALEQHNVWTNGNGGSAFKQQAHIFKPQKKDGNPSTNWILLEEKLRIQTSIRSDFSSGLLQFTPGYDTPSIDWLEEFVRRDHARHCSTEQQSSLVGRNDYASTADPLAYLVNTPPRQRSSPLRSNGSSRRSNNNRSLSAVAQSPPTQSASSYIPQYASGPFAVLAALHLAMHSKHLYSNGRRLLTLTEDQLKRMAQPLCRSNLYDKARIRGRNAFACMDGLIEKQLVRKEIVRNNNAGADGGEIEKWGLLRDAEELGMKCADFDRAVNHVIPLRSFNGHTHKLKSSMHIALCLDTREDVHLLERMKMSCKDENVPFIEKELPAGDYLFIDQSGLEEYVLPLVVERKSWSDLADSCLGRGRAVNRLDCVKLGSSSGGCSGNCQLCKMKRCGCRRVMFIIEGERCLGTDSVHRTAKKCTKESCCSACKLLSERHEVTQDALEGVLHRLQIEHGCFIVYSRSYNETMSLLFDIRTLLEESNHIFGEERLLFETYASNARRKSSAKVHQAQQPRPTRVQDVNVETMVSLVGSCEWDLDLVHSFCGEVSDLGARPNYSPSRRKTSDKSDGIVIELNESEDDEDSLSDLDCANNDRTQTNTVYLDSNSEDEIQLVTEIRGGGDKYNLSSDDEVEALSYEGVEARGGIGNNSQASNIGSDCESDDDPFSNLGRFNKDERRKSMATSLDSDDSSSEDSIILLGQGNSAKNRTLPAAVPAKLTMSGKRGSMASSVAKRLHYDSDDDSQYKQPCKASELPASASALFKSTTPPSTTKKRKASNYMNYEKRNVNLHCTERVYPLLILHGWADYDRQFHHRLDKMWKEICPYKSDNDQMNDFYTESVYRLKARIQDSGFALIRRRTLMRFTLWMQLAIGVQIRSVQRMRFADEIKSYFHQSETPLRAIRSLALSSGSFAPETTRLGPRSTPAASSTHRTASRDRVFQSAMKSVDKNYPTSSNRDIDSVREARLKRFDKQSSERQDQNPITTWSCLECTFENNLADATCAMCGCIAPSKLPSMTVQMWSCSRCTFQNEIDCNVCSACDTPKTTSLDIVAKAVSTSLPSPYRPNHSMSSSKVASKRVARCGACGKEDHTRANATEFNCPAYNDEKEVDRREKIRLKREESLASEQAQIRAIEREAATSEKMQAELARINEELKRNNERAESFRREEIKRRKRKVQRLQKRQNGTT
jgi:ERCC4-type nuclease